LLCHDFLTLLLDDSYFSKIVCFEAIEHVLFPSILLKLLLDCLKSDGTLYISSPNETLNPFSKENYPFHTRHWTPKEFESMINEAGFKVVEWYSQKDKSAHGMNNHPFGRTMIAVCHKI
jgi:hypothetical protein